MNDEIERLARIVEEASDLVFFTGAGVSTASGINDFRSPGGVWSRMKPIEYADFLADEAVRLEDWRRRFRFTRQFLAVEPNVAHRVVAGLVAQGRARGVVTQNIDGLHARAGLDPDRLVELHGNGLSAACLECAAPYALDALERGIEETGRAPICSRCGGIVKARVVSFGQPMPEEPIGRASEWALACDAMIAVGSSLVVNPAARLPEIARRTGARLVIVNREPTPLDERADLVVRQEISSVFEALGRRLGVGA